MNLKKTIILLLYMSSATIIGIALYVMGTENVRSVDVEYIVESTTVPKAVLEKLNKKKGSNHQVMKLNLND